MTIKESVVQAIIKLDIDLLDLILDQEFYMDVPKAYFLEKLGMQFSDLKAEGITEFVKIIKGSCNSCYKDCGGYTFVSSNNRTLDLIFIEDGENVKDIFICFSFKTEEYVEKNSLYFEFKEDEKITYQPSQDIIDIENTIGKIFSDFKKLENTIVEIDSMQLWINEYKALYETCNYLDEYTFVCTFLNLYRTVLGITALKNEFEFAKAAMTDYNSIDLNSESEIINWLLEYCCSRIARNDDYTVTEHWETTNFIVLKNDILEYGREIIHYDNIIIDVNPYQISVKFSLCYSNLYQKYTEKYSPTPEMFEKYGRFNGLGDYLYAWDVHSELLLKHNYLGFNFEFED